MTKKDYILIAQVIRDSHQFWTEGKPGQMAESRDTFAFQMSNALKAENPRFDRDIFHEACKK